MSWPRPARLVPVRTADPPSSDRLITALNALKSKASIHTITAGNRHSTARWVCDREEAGKVAVTLRDLVNSASLK